MHSRRTSCRCSGRAQAAGEARTTAALWALLCRTPNNGQWRALQQRDDAVHTLLVAGRRIPAVRAKKRAGRMRQLRQRTEEPVFDSLIQHYGMRRVNTRGRNSAHKKMLLTVIILNPRKLLKHQSQQVLRLAIALPKPPWLRNAAYAPGWRVGLLMEQLGTAGTSSPATYSGGAHFGRLHFCTSARVRRWP